MSDTSYTNTAEKQEAPKKPLAYYRGWFEDNYGPYVMYYSPTLSGSFRVFKMRYSEQLQRENEPPVVVTWIEINRETGGEIIRIAHLWEFPVGDESTMASPTYPGSQPEPEPEPEPVQRSLFRGKRSRQYRDFLPYRNMKRRVQVVYVNNDGSAEVVDVNPLFGGALKLARLIGLL